MVEAKDFIKYYLRDDVAEAIMKSARKREVAVRLGEKGFGKRPDILQFKGDVTFLAKRGATSFHISEEKWSDPLILKPGMNRKELDDARIAWDLIIDIDGANVDYSAMTAKLVLELFKEQGVKNVSIKFSGNKGFHIGVPFESFPKKVNNMDIGKLFPDGPRTIAGYINYRIKSKLREMIFSNKSVEDVAEEIGKKVEDLTENGELNPFAVVDIDSVLISNRHMFRAPYSMHEKSGLVSIPIKDIESFTKEDAKPENVKVDLSFLDYDFSYGDDARMLFISALDWNSHAKTRIVFEKKSLEEYEIPSEAIAEKFFPPCIQKILAGKLEDGRKRCVFVLINFLKNVGWSFDLIKKRLSEWNKTHDEPLRDNYIFAQINWYRKQNKTLLPPNCSNAAYYKDLGMCIPNEVCIRGKNPVNFALKRYKGIKNNSKKKAIKKTKN